MIQRVAQLVLCLGLVVGNIAIAGDAIYMAETDDAVPRFSTQPYDSSYSVYSSSADPLPIAARTFRSPLNARRTALAPYIQEIAQRHGLDPALISAVADVESGFNPNAVSPKGAVGTMQLIPTTAAAYGVTDRYDVQQNLDGGARYLKDLLAAHDGNLPLALAAYNAGTASVARHHQRIPPYDETMLYVPRVLAKMAAYQRNETVRWP